MDPGRVDNNLHEESITGLSVWPLPISPPRWLTLKHASQPGPSCIKVLGVLKIKQPSWCVYNSIIGKRTVAGTQNPEFMAMKMVVLGDEEVSLVGGQRGVGIEAGYNWSENALWLGLFL